MYNLDSEEPFTVLPLRLAVEEARSCRWSIYVVRVDLTRHEQAPAIKIGMVGTGTIGQRIEVHTAKYGKTELLDAWTLTHAVGALPDPQPWRLVEQYEARLQFADSNRLVIDLSRTMFIDSTRLKALVDMWRSRVDAGREVPPGAVAGADADPRDGWRGGLVAVGHSSDPGDRCRATAARTPAAGLSNTALNPSPAGFRTRPPACSIGLRTRRS